MDSLLISAMTLSDFLGYASAISKTALGLGFVIFIHELGHFLAAKACGVKCEKFYVGFDPPIKIFGFPLPRTLGKFQWGETEYGIGIIPLGGYVKMLGQDDDPRLASQAAERERIRAEGGDADDESISSPADLATSTAPATLDPRSYPAKTVPQRMVIISAGVIMNLISAVFLAAAAYGLGVAYIPCEFSGTMAGDPAWRAGIEPGDKLVQIGKEGEPDEHYRFKWELRHKVVHAGFSGQEKPMDFMLRKRDGSEVWVPIKPKPGIAKVLPPTIGVLAPLSNRIGKPPFYLDSAGARAEPKLEPGDRVVAVNGNSLDDSTKNESGEIRSEEIESLLIENKQDPVRLTVMRRTESEGSKEAKETQLEVVVPPAKYRDTGLIMQMGPVVAVRNGSPAGEAGVRVGDVIESIDGELVKNPVRLPMRYGHVVDRELTLVVQRGKDKEKRRVEISLMPQRPSLWSSSVGPYLSLDAMGIAYSVPLVVADVTPGSPAAKAKLKAGDRLTQGRYVIDDEELIKKLEAFIPSIREELKNFPLGSRESLKSKATKDKRNQRNWVAIDSNFQMLPQSVQLEVTYERNGTPATATLAAVETDIFYPERGIHFGPFERVHVAESAGEALSLGFRETREKFTEVISFLGLLFSGKVSPDNLGGPVRIAQLAGSEASVSIARLLLFLTFLSCNLAIVNFLPIPALDGGHFAFLLWELVTGRPPNENIQATLTLVGFVFLLGLMIFVIGNDVYQTLQ